MENSKLKEIAEEFIEEYESRGSNMNMYPFYADFKRALENKEKEIILKPLFPSQVKVNKQKTILKMVEDKFYIFEEIDYRTNEIVFQMIIKSWNSTREYSQFDIKQVLFGTKFQNYLPEDIYDTDKTSIHYNRTSEYENRIKLYEYKEDMLEEFNKIHIETMFPKRDPQPQGYRFIKGQR